MEFDLLIIGMGPAGATAALFCAEAGMNVAVVERDREVYRLPRAVNLDGEIVRAYQRINRAEDVDNLMQTRRPWDAAGFANSRREWMFGTKFVDYGSNGWQPLNMFDQPELERYMRTQALEHPRVHALIGYEAGAPQDSGDAVTLTATPDDGGETITLSGRYALACDGASSPTRRALDIEWESLGYDRDWLVVDVTTQEGHTLDIATLQVCDPDRLSTFVCTKDPYRRWEFRMNSGETAEHMLEDETIYSLIDPWTPRGTYEIRRKAVYQFHAATAATWHVGNIFIAGDAAHQTPPFLGQGMNAGLRDVLNFSWKLALVRSGRADEALLDTYQAERDAHARDLVEWAVAIGRLMEHLADVERAERNGEAPPDTPDTLKSSGYGQGREQPPLRAGVVLLEQVSDTGSTGYLFSQPLVSQPDGKRLRLDEILGPGFALVALDPANLALDERSRAILQHVDAPVISLEGLTEEKGHIDRLYEHADAAIVRPDRIVFGHTTPDLSANDLVHALADKLHLKL